MYSIVADGLPSSSNYINSPVLLAPSINRKLLALFPNTTSRAITLQHFGRGHLHTVTQTLPDKINRKRVAKIPELQTSKNVLNLDFIRFSLNQIGANANAMSFCVFAPLLPNTSCYNSATTRTRIVYVCRRRFDRPAAISHRLRRSLLFMSPWVICCVEK
jgi:hypothetical protein